MDTKDELVTFRAFSYGGAAACFALLPFLWPNATESWFDHSALIAAACGLPFLVAAGWMADTRILLHRPEDEGSLYAANEFESRSVIFSAGAAFLFLSVDLELVKIDIWTGGIFLLACVVAAVVKQRHARDARAVSEAAREGAIRASRGKRHVAHRRAVIHEVPDEPGA